MELKFENTATLDKDALLAMDLRNRNPVFSVAVAVMCVYFVFSGIRSAFSGAWTSLLPALVYALILAAFWYFLPRMQAWFEYRRNWMAYNRDPRCITKFYADRFTVENLATDKTLSITYGHIRRISEDERYYFLLLDSKVISLVDKSGFLLGTAEDFGAFIREKAVNTKRGGGKPDNAL